MPAPSKDSETDARLVDAWRAGDEQAASELVARHAMAVQRFVARLGVGGDVEDVVQETFIKAFAAMDTFRADSALRTWLYTIARRLVIDRQRAAARRGTRVDIADTHAVSEYGALDALVADEVSERIHKAVAALTPMQRAVFLLRIQDGQSYRDLAEVLGTTEGAARVHYHNAMRAVKEFLHEPV